jgi:very-short-patch-repair endonuclease
LAAAVADIGGGAEALSEIDFVRLCRRHGLPAPVQQLRRDPSGRRRYLDATWRRADGRLVVVEVDGALHLAARRWWDDQLRQNELALADALVLRFPSVVVRTKERLVASQLRRALRLR